MWQMWNGQLSPALESIRLKAFGGWIVDRGTTQLHARIHEGNICAGEEPKQDHGQKLSKRNCCPTSALRHRCSISLYTKFSIDKRHISQRVQHHVYGDKHVMRRSDEDGANGKVSTICTPQEEQSLCFLEV